MQVDPHSGRLGCSGSYSRGSKNHVFSTQSVSRSRQIAIENAPLYDHLHDAVESRLRSMTLKDAGEALRRLRKRRGWTLDDVAAMTGVTKMAISHLERATKSPRPSTVARIESGLGWPAGSFYRLADAADADDAALDKLVDSFAVESESPAASVLPGRRISGADVLEGYTEAYIDTIDSVIEQLPPPSSPRFSSTVTAALGHCGKVAVLTASSWRVAAVGEREAASRLLRMLRDLESKRRALLDRVPDSMAARFDSACRRSGLPEALIGVLTGLTGDEVWMIRAGGAVPEGSNARLAAFIRAVDSGELADDSGAHDDGSANGS